MGDQPPDDHDRPGMVPHDPPASCPACGWREDVCHC